MLKNAPFFNRIKLWRKFKGHAVFGSGGLIGPSRGGGMGRGRFGGGRGVSAPGRGGGPGMRPSMPPQQQGNGGQYGGGGQSYR